MIRIEILRGVWKLEFNMNILLKKILLLKYWRNWYNKISWNKFIGLFINLRIIIQKNIANEELV